MGRAPGQRQTRYWGSKWVGISFGPRAVTGNKRTSSPGCAAETSSGDSLSGLAARGQGCWQEAGWGGGGAEGRGAGMGPFVSPLSLVIF